MFALLTFALLAVASANVINHEGQCPDLKAVENFDVKSYTGLWYEISKYPTEAEQKGKCATAEYTADGESVKVKNTHVIDGVQTYIEGSAKLSPDANKAGKLIVTFKFGDIVRESPLNVLATDYKNYAIAYNCKYDEKTKNHRVYAWILSRSKKLEGDAKTAVDNFLKANSKELDATKFVQTDFSEAACKFTSTSLITEQPPKPAPAKV